MEQQLQKHINKGLDLLEEMEKIVKKVFRESDDVKTRLEVKQKMLQNLESEVANLRLERDLKLEIYTLMTKNSQQSAIISDKNKQIETLKTNINELHYVMKELKLQKYNEKSKQNIAIKKEINDVLKFNTDVFKNHPLAQKLKESRNQLKLKRFNNMILKKKITDLRKKIALKNKIRKLIEQRQIIEFAGKMVKYYKTQKKVDDNLSNKSEEIPTNNLNIKYNESTDKNSNLEFLNSISNLTPQLEINQSTDQINDEQISLNESSQIDKMESLKLETDISNYSGFKSIQEITRTSFEISVLQKLDKLTTNLSYNELPEIIDPIIDTPETSNPSKIRKQNDKLTVSSSDTKEKHVQFKESEVLQDIAVKHSLPPKQEDITRISPLNKAKLSFKESNNSNSSLNDVIDTSIPEVTKDDVLFLKPLPPLKNLEVKSPYFQSANPENQNVNSQNEQNISGNSEYFYGNENITGNTSMANTDEFNPIFYEPDESDVHRFLISPDDDSYNERFVSPVYASPPHTTKESAESSPLIQTDKLFGSGAKPKESSSTSFLNFGQSQSTSKKSVFNFF